MAARGLGKGLDSLIPNTIGESKGKADKGTGTENKNPETMVKLTAVEPNRDQPRKNFDEDALLELAESIKQFGLLQPILVQERDGYYEIIAGERRWRAAKIAGLKEVPVIIKNLTDQEIVEISLIENIQREDLNPIEEAQAYEVQQMVVNEMITTGHARALLSIEDPEEQYMIAQKVFDEKMSVREVEKLVKNLHKPEKPKKAENKSLEVIYQNIEEKLKESLGTKVSISSKDNGAGKIQIEFYDHDDLDRLMEYIIKN